MSEEAGRENGVTVIGAGIVGVCCALHLQEKGFVVTIIDRLGPGEATSFGNAGVISPWSFVPQCLPGVWKNVPRWLLDPHGPVRARFSILPKLLPWSLSFFANARTDKLRSIVDTMQLLARDNALAYRAFLNGTGREDLVRDSWYVNVFRSGLKPDLNDLVWNLRRERGAPLEIIDAHALREIEPDLSHDYHSAILIKDQARAMAPGEICKVLAEKALNQGAQFVTGDVVDLRPVPDGGFEIVLKGRSVRAEKVVLCAGIWTDALLRKLGIKLPLMAERGYHLEFRDPGVSLNNSVMDVTQKFIVSSMEGGIRAAGTSEFAHVDSPPNYKRADILAPLTKRMLPNLNATETVPWMGTRPSFPDSLPVIDRLPGFKNLFGAFGHGHYGLGMAPATGRLLAQLVSGTPPNISLDKVRATRF